MTRSGRWFNIITWLVWIALGALAFVVVVAEFGVAASVESLAEFLPVLTPVQTPLVAVAAAFGLCVLTVLVVTGVLVGYTRADRIFHPSALRLVDVLVGAVIAATAVTAVALFFIPGPPQLFLLVGASVPAGVTITLVLLVMRALLRRAVAMRIELDEVV